MKKKLQTFDKLIKLDLNNLVNTNLLENRLLRVQYFYETILNSLVGVAMLHLTSTESQFISFS